MHHLLQIWFDWVLHGGYLGIIVLMALESAIFPVASEIVIPPAAFQAAQGTLNLWVVIAAEMLREPAGLTMALKAKSHVIGAAVIVLCFLYFLVMRLTAHRDETPP